MDLQRVAPLAGAWIEIGRIEREVYETRVAPLAGAWIEIRKLCGPQSMIAVAPLAGAWIEIAELTRRLQNAFQSLPSRERGLKLHVVLP